MICWICDEPTGGGQGVPVFEGDIVPDTWPGDWGGMPACRDCYDTVRQFQAVFPGALLSQGLARRLVGKGGSDAERTQEGRSDHGRPDAADDRAGGGSADGEDHEHGCA